MPTTRDTSRPIQPSIPRTSSVGGKAQRWQQHVKSHPWRSAFCEWCRRATAAVHRGAVVSPPCRFYVHGAATSVRPSGRSPWALIANMSANRFHPHRSIVRHRASARVFYPVTQDAGPASSSRAAAASGSSAAGSSEKPKKSSSGKGSKDVVLEVCGGRKALKSP